MIKEIVKDQFFLSQKSIDCTKDDLFIATDLLDTIKYHNDICVGIAANMIGELKRMMVINDHNQYLILINPVIIQKSSLYKTKESCLCHIVEKEVERYKKIKVEYLDIHFKKKIN